ncbi:MAG: NAD(P)-binding protein [Verrucomicrobia bacterium]|nr:NAD(P)-binding protein [Verrucomicrobiota bacterium]
MTKPSDKRVLIVGAGFSGAVIARELAEAGIASLVIDQRPHLAGNCYTARDAETGVMEHVYGPHIFNTSNLEVWKYIQRWCTMGQYVNRVKASTSRGIFSLPINLHTINQFFGLKLDPRQARKFLASKADHSITNPQNFEEQALSMIGRELYETFFYGYTKKQWGCEPRELPASILKRLPVRFNYDDNYYHSRYQGVPVDGYTTIIQRILDHELIEVKLETTYEHGAREEFNHLFFTGALDAFYSYEYGRLRYRTVYWDKLTTDGDYQGNPVINYTELTEPFTRVHEHKHFAPWEEHERTIVFTEFSKETTPDDVPYYPKRLEGDLALLRKYRQLALEEENITFLGRLATYRYLDMHVVIAEALQTARDYLNWKSAIASARPVFGGEPPIETRVTATNLPFYPDLR